MLGTKYPLSPFLTKRWTGLAPFVLTASTQDVHHFPSFMRDTTYTSSLAREIEYWFLRASFVLTWAFTNIHHPFLSMDRTELGWFSIVAEARNRSTSFVSTLDRNHIKHIGLTVIPAESRTSCTEYIIVSLFWTLLTDLELPLGLRFHITTHYLFF
jgi:hypothetical protein